MTVSAQIQAVLAAAEIDCDVLQDILDDLAPMDRVESVLALTARDQRRLWQAAEGRATTLLDLVPKDVPSAQEVVHIGKNSLPVFSRFEKRFCTDRAAPRRLYGYNEGMLRPLIGAGYFTAALDDKRAEVAIDYCNDLPRDVVLPAGWPGLQSNNRGITSLVFGGMVDYLRKVSTHVSVGRAMRKGRMTANYFVLCRAR